MNLEGLNERQREAVEYTDGSLLIIAGAGSGKTRVLTHRIAYLIEECGVSPYNILAITFTNKAAAEMKERVDNITDNGNQVWVSTFHSTCVRILRRYIDRIGYNLNFTIYDTDDAKSVIKDICKKLNIDTKMLKERTIMSAISRAKDEYTSPEQYLLDAGNDYNMKRIAQVYVEYQKELKLNNALDFDDLIFKTVELFTRCPDVLENYQDRFRYIMVDEYQDTNTIQFNLISLIAERYGNLCVVGDDDQSIYKFRGANIENILNFEKVFNNAKVIKLEQNYRSTQTILDAANSVIAHNVGRKSKTLWTDNSKGDRIPFNVYEDGYREAEGVVESICAKVRDGWNYNDIAILYRTNAQSRVLEEKLVMRNVPYRIYGGVNFYQRKEIKDILAYLKTIDNGSDGQAIKRIINVPKRGIGATTIDRIQQYADANDITFWDALCNAAEIPDIGRSLGKLENFVTFIQGYKARLQFKSIEDITNSILEDTGYMEYLAESETREEVEARQENIDEFINKIIAFESGDADETDGNEDRSLGAFLSDVALISDIDNMSGSVNQVNLMTLHSAKGLEFPIVFLTGLEDGLFPGYMSIMADDPSEIEEERRLCYVGITRAEKELYLSCAKQRMVRGEVQMNKVSRFVKEIPQEYLEMSANTMNAAKSKVSFEEAEETGRGVRFNPRAQAKDVLSRYGSGDTQQYSSYNRKSIGGSRSGGLAGNVPTTRYGSGTTNYGTGAGHGASSSGDKAAPTRYGSATNYGSKKSATLGTGIPVRGLEAPRGVQAHEPSAEQLAAIRDVAAARKNKKVGFGKEFPVGGFARPKDSGLLENGLGYTVGDTVSHVKFGEGKVLDIANATKDYMVTVDFAEYGVKKMLAGFARLKKM